MSSDDHDRISELFLAACDLDPEEQRAYLDKACTNAAERARVESWLAHDGELSLRPGAGLAMAGLTSGPDCLKQTISLRDEVPEVEGYRNLRPLAHGAMGMVYQAEDIALRRQVAIKTVLPAAGVDAPGRFIREAQTMARVEHPHVVRVYALLEAKGAHYLVMEFIEGEGLHQRLERPGKVEVDEALRILRQTSDGLAAAWKHGIVHRDVKPANLLIDTDNQVHVADFGLAKMTDLQGDPSITTRGTVVGTPSYMSPEQARGVCDPDFRTDVYSLGIVLFEMLTGQLPFQGATPFAVVVQQRHVPLPSARALRPELSAAVEQLCNWMTSKEPDDRPASYEVLRHGIDALIHGDPAPVALRSTIPDFLVDDGVGTEVDVGAGVFVGRERELAKLDGYLDHVLAGQGRVVFVTGEAGSGKTALASEFARQAQAAHADLIVVHGQCNAQTGLGDPYLPFREALGLLTGDVEAKTASATISKGHARRLWRLLPVAAEAIIEGGPDLVGTFLRGGSLMARAAAHAPDGADWRARLEQLAIRKVTTPVDVNLQQGQLFDQYTRTLRTLAQRHPLLLHLEDLHWADVGSCSMLFHLGRQLAGSPILILGSYRPADISLKRDGQRHPLEPVINELKRQFGELELNLDGEGTSEFVEALVDLQPNALGAGFREALFRQTRGHPLFTVELLRAMQERGMLIRDDENRWIDGPALDWDTLPARVEGVISERIGQLSDHMQEILSLASVQGEEFIAEVLAGVRGTDEREMVGLLSRELDKRHVLVSAKGSRRIGGQRISRYRFRHVVFQKYLYGRIDEVERSYLHEDVGKNVERLYGERAAEAAIELARHFDEAGVTEKAIDYLRQAGEGAVRLSANEEALGHLRKGLDRVETLPEGPERDRLELSLQLALGAPLLATAGPGSAELGCAYERARLLCGQVGNDRQLFQTLLLLVHHHASQGQLSTSLELSDRLLTVAQGAGGDVPVVVAHWARAFALNFMGRFREALEELERLLELYRVRDHGLLAYVYGVDPGVSALSFKGHILWYLGNPVQADQCIEEALSLAREVDHPSSTAHALIQASSTAMFARDLEALDARTEALVQLCNDKGIKLFEAWAVLFRGWLSTRRGQIDEGIAQMRQGLDAIQATGSQLSLATALGKLAEAHGTAGNVDEGLKLVSQAISAVERTDERVSESEFLRIKGDLLLAQNSDLAAAEASFQQSLDVASRQQAKSCELRAATSLGRLWQSRGKRNEARALVTEVYGRFTEGFAAADLRDARKLLEELA